MTEGNRIYSYVLLHLRSDYSGAVQPPAWQRSGMGGEISVKITQWCSRSCTVFSFGYGMVFLFGYGLFIQV